MLFLFGLLFSLIIPCLIVGFWRKRPVADFITASIVLFLSLIAPGFIKTFQAMMIYGSGDPQLMAGSISQAIVSGILLLVFALPLLYLFQWFMRRRYRNKLTKSVVETTFT